MKFLSVVLLLLVIVAFNVSGQVRRNSRALKKPVIRATVTVKAGPSTVPVWPAETDTGIWNEFSSSDGRIKILLPALADTTKWFSENVGTGGEALMLAANTKHARYQIVTRPAPQFTDNRDIEDVLERSIQAAYSRDGVTIRGKRNIFYDGVIGKEFSARSLRAEGVTVEYVRSHILDSKMILLFVRIVDPANEEKLMPWIEKFFESLVVPPPMKKEVG